MQVSWGQVAAWRMRRQFLDPRTFDRWLSLNATSRPRLRGWFADMRSTLTEVDVEGRKALMLTEHVEDLVSTDPWTDGEVVDLSSRVVLLTPAEVAKRLGMSRSTVRRRILDGDLKTIKVGTHHRIPLAEYERFSDELMLRMTQASAADIEVDLFGE